MCRKVCFASWVYSAKAVPGHAIANTNMEEGFLWVQDVDDFIVKLPYSCCWCVQCSFDCGNAGHQCDDA